MKKVNKPFQYLFFTLLTVSLILLLKKPTTETETKTKNQTINVYVWGDFFNNDLIKKFERRHNVNVKFSYYLSNEELLTKIRNTDGNCADIIFPSDYAVKILIDENHLQKIDYSKIDFFNKIDSFLLNKPFDPYNVYSLPYVWEVYGILEDKCSAINSKTNTINSLMIDKTIKHITMPSDPIEMFCITCQALYGNVEKKSKDELKKIATVIKNQKKRIHAYVDYQAKNIFAGKCSPIGFTRSSYFSLLTEENPNHSFQFTLPNDGLFITIENMVILKKGKNKDIIYKFINDIYKEKNMLKHTQECPTFPAFEQSLNTENFTQEHINVYNRAKQHNKLCYFNYFVNEKTIKKEWVKIKAT